MSFPPQSAQQFGRYEKIYKIIGTCLWHEPRGRHRWLPQGSCPSNLAIDIHSLNRTRPLVWPAPWAIAFLQGFARSHVARATCNRSVRNYYHRLSAAPAYRMTICPSRSVQPFGLQSRKCLDRHTNIIRPTFFQRTTRGNLRA